MDELKTPPIDGVTTQPVVAKRPRKGPPLNPREQIARAEVVMAKRLARTPIEDVCRDLNISRTTYYRALGQARTSNLYEQARDFLLEDLMPRALKVYALALEGNDVEVARDVINGLGLLGKHTTLAFGDGVTEGDSVTFERWRMQRGASGAGPPLIEAERVTAGDPDPAVYPEGVAAPAASDAEGAQRDGNPGPAPPATTRKGIPEGGVDGERLRGGVASGDTTSSE